LLLALSLVLLLIRTLILLWIPTLILLLLERVDPALHQVAVVLAVGIVCAQLQRGLVGLHRLGPFLQGFLRVGLFGLLSGTIQRIA